MKRKRVSMADVHAQLKIMAVLFEERSRRFPMQRRTSKRDVARQTQKAVRERAKWLRLIHRQLVLARTLLEIRADQDKQWSRLVPYAKALVLLKIQELAPSKKPVSAGSDKGAK